MKLQNKVVVITGAASGIGRAMAHLFASEGAKVVAADRNGKALAEVVAEVCADPVVKAGQGDIMGVEGDIGVQADAEALIDEAVTVHGRVDVLCNNAGVMDQNQGVGELSDEHWRRVLRINLDGPMYASRRVVPVMLKQGGGSIINTASVAGIGGGSAGVAYTVSKHGVVGLTRSTAWMYGPRGIRCNAIAAGGVETNITASMDLAHMDPEGSQRTGVHIASMPHALKPIDIAQLALFLASDESRYINGAIIPADAGWSVA